MTESLTIHQPNICQSPLALQPSPRKLYQINADGSEWLAPDLTEAERAYVESQRNLFKVLMALNEGEDNGGTNTTT